MWYTSRLMLQRLHARLGDFWWYSLMLFAACRSGDAIQAFIGLWLVPRYVGPEELGAVIPLQSLAGFLTAPLAIVAVVFSKYVSVYATRGEFGKVKGFIRDVFSATAVLFAVCFGAAYLVVPFFYERLRVVSGSLTLLVLLCGLMGNVSTIVTSAQQGLKRFRTMSAMSLLGAPIRLATLLVAMPYRALSGYILGQTTPNAATSLLSAIDLRRALRPYAPDASWRRDLPAILRCFWPYALCSAVSCLSGAMTATVYRQRLPEIESAAYYMLTRFSDIVSFVAATVGFILFPLASEAHERGREDRSLMTRTILATLGGAFALALVFWCAAGPLFSLTETWRAYAPYTPLLPVLALSTGFGLSTGIVANYEFACGRIGATAVNTALNAAWTALLVAFTGADFFAGVLPPGAIAAMHAARLDRLGNLVACTLVFQTLLLGALLLLARRAERQAQA